jgi:GNAT superfamily N-acetyltransferase
MQIAPVSEPQHESLTDLLCELHAHYHPAAGVSRDVVRSHLRDHLLAAGSPLRLVVASRGDGGDGAVVGFVAIALLYSLVEPTPDKHRQCLVKELFVRAPERSHGVGRALMAWVARHAVDSGCCRIDWPVNASNRRGIAFYEGLGAERVADRLSYRLAGSNLARLAARERT